MEKPLSPSVSALSDHLTRCNEYFPYRSVQESYASQLQVVMNLLVKRPELAAYQGSILSTIERLVIAYAADQRKVEKIGRIARPKVFHHLEALKIGLLQLTILKDPKRHNLPKRTRQKADILFKEVSLDIVGYVLGLLHHDSPEDNKFVLVDKMNNHDPELIEDYFLDIENQLDWDEERILRYVRDHIDMEKIEDFIEDAGLREQLFGILFAIQDTGSLDEVITMDAHADVKTQLSLYHIMCALQDDGFSEKQITSCLWYTYALTQKKIGDMKIDDDAQYYHRIEQSLTTLLLKLVDTIANSTSINKNSEYLSEKDKQKQQTFLKKYGYRMDRLQTEMPFFLDLTEKTYEYFGYIPDSFMKVVFRQRQQIAALIEKPFTRNVVDHYIPIHKDTTPYEAFTPLWTEQIVSNSLGAKTSDLVETLSTNSPLDRLRFLHTHGFLEQDDVKVMDAFRWPFNKYETYRILDVIFDDEMEWDVETLDCNLTNKGLGMLNDILNRSLKFNTEEQLLHLPQSFINKWCKKHTDGTVRIEIPSGNKLLRFLQDAKKGRGLYQVALCEILKDVYCNILTYFSQKVQDIDYKFTKMLEVKILPFLQPLSPVHGANVQQRVLEKVQENELLVGRREVSNNKDVRDEITTQIKDNCKYVIKLVESLLVMTDVKSMYAHNRGLEEQDLLERILPKIHPIQIKKIYLRGKGGESVPHKFYKKPVVNLDTVLADLLGAKYEVHTPQDMMLAMNQFDELIYGGKAEIKVKGIIRVDEVEEYKEQLSPHFYKRLLVATRQREKVKENEPLSSDEYEDARLSGPVMDDPGYPQLESQFVLSNTDNEQWFAAHSIYTGVKLLNTNMRQTGYVTEDYIEFVSKRAAYKYPEIRKLGENDIEKTTDVVCKYIASKFTPFKYIPVGRSKKAMHAYTSSMRRNVLHKRGWFNKNFSVYDSDRKRWVSRPVRRWHQDVWCKQAYSEIMKVINIYENSLNNDQEKIAYTFLDDIQFAIRQFSGTSIKNAKSKEGYKLKEQERQSHIRILRELLQQLIEFLGTIPLLDEDASHH